MIKVFNRVPAHTELLHHANGSQIARHGKRNHFGKFQNFKSMTKKCPGTLGCQPFAPVFPRQALADFNAWGESCFKLGNEEADVSDELMRFTQFRSPGPESMLFKVRLSAIHQRVALLPR